MKKKIKLIYIAGNGHSGSTLLEMILGTAKNTFALGEVKALNVLAKNGSLCYCGKTLQECSFWNKICKNFVDLNLIPWTKKNRERLPLLCAIWFNTKLPHYPDEKRLYSLLIKQAKKFKGEKVDTLVDASKDLRRLIYLSSLNKFDISVVHLIRDGRAVINSHEKQGYGSIMSYINWLIMNSLIRIYTKTSKLKTLQISYDQFAQNPNKIIRRIETDLDIDISTNNYIKNLQNEKYHTFGGNKVRFSKIKSIQYDESWKKRMPKWKQFILTLICYLPNKLWVYNRDIEKK